MSAVRVFFIHAVSAKRCVYGARTGCQCVAGTIYVDAGGGLR